MKVKGPMLIWLIVGVERLCRACIFWISTVLFGQAARFQSHSRGRRTGCRPGELMRKEYEPASSRSGLAKCVWRYKPSWSAGTGVLGVLRAALGWARAAGESGGCFPAASPRWGEAGG